ncbi:MAG: class I SAM-dependent methyltransferase [Candidatus Spyradocola sp.]|jgi:16S rRNA (guanine1207-N2)-methyltransferase
MYEAELFSQRVRIAAAPGLFSPQAADRGTLAMAAQVELRPGQRLLDLGCGAGLIGIAAAKVLGEEAVVLTDVDPAAVRCARENAVRNGVPGVQIVQGDALDAVDATGFDWILSNPPYHADFSVPKRFIEKGFNRLKLGGSLVMVVKRLPWYRNKLTAVFGGVRVCESDGYYVLTAQRRTIHYAEKKIRPNRA